MSRVLSALLSLLVLYGVTSVTRGPSESARQSVDSAHEKITRVARGDFVGDALCAECHQSLSSTYHQTRHSRTSALPSRAAIIGSFEPGQNELTTLDPDLLFRMSEAGGKFFQTAIFTGAPHARKVTRPFDIVVGSGRKGQTYLYWKGDALFQLPVSAWQASGWVNSPGYLDGTADFDRPITQRCMECHGSYFESLTAGALANRYDTGNFMLGITCERCHGAGREHVTLHKSAAAEEPGAVRATKATAAALPKMENPANLGRDQQIEVCAQCHGGIGRPLRSAFAYFPGQPLNLYLERQTPDPNANVDVHGNQVALLARSRCFQSSGTLSCLTCHAPHEPEKPAGSYSLYCLTCHKPRQCGEFARLGQKIAENCIDCHMPTQASKAIVFGLNGKEIRAQVRTHWIKVYGAAPKG